MFRGAQQTSTWDSLLALPAIVGHVSDAIPSTRGIVILCRYSKLFQCTYTGNVRRYRQEILDAIGDILTFSFS